MRDRSSPGRPREFDDTEALRKIMTLFWKQGFEGVSLSQIMAATGLQKASLYAAFGDKRSMYLKALEQYHAETVTGAARALKDPGVLATDRIRAFLTAPIAAAENQDRSGCFLCNASADQAGLDVQTEAQVQRGFTALASALETPLAELNHALSRADLETRAHMLLGLYSGFRIMARSGVDVGKLRPGVEVALQAVR
ncbi:MAG: TetR/AcrR family transcriptional regulator [Hyphomonadaceae bacterium]|nr:TetR/AcrR family transcriptional regulator [Hyphomonadaceae bacterium]